MTASPFRARPALLAVLVVALPVALGAAMAAGAAQAADPAGPPPPAVAGAARKAPGDSLLFSAAAQGLIEQARLGRGRPAAPVADARAASSAPPAPSGIIHLSAIVYRAPDDWRIWLNGRSFTPGARPGALEILEVTAAAVRLTWRGGPGQRAPQIELKPNQSYLIASGEIVEGKLRPLPLAPPPAPRPGGAKP